MRTRASIDLERWVLERGGVRAAARELGCSAPTLSRWITGRQAPRGTGDLGPAWVEKHTGVAAVGWGVLVDETTPTKPAPHPAPPAPRSAPTKGTATPRCSPPTSARAEPASEQPPAPPPSPPPPVAAASLEELQRRARQIPGELQQLRERMAAGAVVTTAGEIMARMLEREARALTSAITAAGTATVKEVEQLQAMLVDVTSGCQVCRDRVTAALRSAAA